MLISKKLSGKNGNERFSERYFLFFPSVFSSLVFAGFVLRIPHYRLLLLQYNLQWGQRSTNPANTKMQNLTEKNEKVAQKTACFHFFPSIFSKSKYMSHPFSISTYRKSKIAPMRHNCVAGINFSGKTAVSKISYQVL